MGNHALSVGAKFVAILIVLSVGMSVAFSKEMDEAARDTLELIERNQTPSMESIVRLHEFSDIRIFEIALWRLRGEINKVEYDKENKLVIDREIIQGLGELITKILARPDFDQTNIKTFEKEIVAAREAFDTKLRHTGVSFKGPMITMFNRLDSARLYVAPVHKTTRNKTYIMNPGSPIAVPDNGVFVSPVERLKKFKEILETRIIEQPEVVRAIYDLEFETLVKGIGNTAEPPFFYLMGLPGVGKDTSAETYIDALYGDDKEAREHLFRIPLQRSKADAWGLFGSATGYIGSSDVQPFVKFLVKHSAGKYMIEEPRGQNDKPYVALNPEWKPGMVLDGYFPPERAVVFLNEFHNWSSEAKAVVMKESLEKGIFNLNNAGNGVARLELPGIRFVAASNEGIELYTNRDAEGTRFGDPLEYEEMMERYNKVANDKDLLRQTIAKTAFKNPPGTPKDERTGTPEEILNRIHPSRMILMRPISPEGLKKIIRLRINRIQRQLDNAERGVYGTFKINVTDALVDFIQKYEYSAEEGARPVGDKVRSLMEYTFYQAMMEASITPDVLKNGVTLDVKANEDRTMTLVVRKGLQNATEVLTEQIILETLKERANVPITDEKIESLLDLEERLRDRIFGAEKAIEKVAKAMLLSEERKYAKKKNWSDHEKATSFAFLGPSSTGKSEMAKALVNELYPDYGEQRRIDIDFNKIQTPHHMEEYIWGYKEGRTVVPSEFMRKYDQFNGDILFVFEETSNTPRDLLRSLYDLFRENHPKFADGKDRPMTNVTIIITGNAGIEWYSGVPRDLPEAVRMAAWNRIYKQAMARTGKTRATLEKYYPEPLINRIGEQNVIWFAPLNFQALRELTLAKTNSFLAKLKPADGRRGWDVGFKSATDHQRVIEIFEREGFRLEEQGASIDRYVDSAVNKELRTVLLMNKVATGARVALAPRVDQSEEEIKRTRKVLLDVIVEGQEKPLTLELEAKNREFSPRTNRNDLIMTAIHEVGHEFVGKILLGDKHKSELITVIPGVAEINGKWIYYAGLRASSEVERLVYTKEAVERVLAGLLAGEVAQTIYSKGQRHDAGKSNDIERATQIARRAVLEWGLSSAWGNRVVLPEEMDKLSEVDRELLNKEVRTILNRSRNLAYNTVLQNKEVFSELSAELIVKGEMGASALDEFYNKNESRLVQLHDQERASTKVDTRLLPKGFNDPNYRKGHNTEIADFFKVPSTVANIDDVVKAERDAEIAKARIPKTLPIFSDFNDATSKKPVLVLAKDRVEQQRIPKKRASAIPAGGTCSRLFAL